MTSGQVRGKGVVRSGSTERFTALEIGEDYVLGLSRDALDVEYIQRYRLEK